VTNFSDFSRLEAKEYKPVLASCNLDGIVRRQIESALIRAERKHISINYEQAASLPDVSVDEIMITRVVMNLLDNAVKYTASGGTVVVRVFNRVAELQVEVEDSGMGIPADRLQFIFDPFYRATREQKGSGLGLAISKNIVESHGGEMSVKSTPGKGSLFGFTLPKNSSVNNITGTFSYCAAA
jgi:signal transduction histidine kinase